MATKKVVAKKAVTKSAVKALGKAAPSKALAKKASAADEVDAQLKRYRGMRNFGVTAEPAGGGEKKAAANREGGLPFVIQKHAASHLHYDFRLGWNGVLKSWAVAKGPSYHVKDRRLAVQVEDHPMEYGGFEGTIPKGQYGGGTVMVWDQGTWCPQAGHEDVDAGLRDGSLKFEMFGSKMKGRWTLVRMGGKAANESKPNWLLIKEHDDFERGPEDEAVTEAEPNSAVTGRSLEQIAAQEDHVWNSKETKTKGQAWFRKDEVKDDAMTSAEMPTKKATVKGGRSTGALKACKAETQPEFVAPELAMEATEPPTSGEWLHELKLDGYRMQARKSGGDVKLLTRKGLDWTHRMPAVAEAVGRLAANDATLDGEVVVLGADGNSNFAELQAAFQSDEKHPLTYFAFDLLHMDGRNTRELGLRERKELLAGILPEGDEALRLSEHLETDGGVMFRHACELHAEGIISKRAGAAYRSGRGGDWLKSKCLREQEFVVGGFTNSTEGEDRIGSLLLGYYDDGKLVYAGRTGTGFTQKLKRELRKKLGAMEVKAAAFAKVPAEAKRGAIWVRPELVAQVRFATWTADDLVRQAAFLGLREDKPAKEVLREEATVAPTPKRHGAEKKVASHKAAAVKVAVKAAPAKAVVKAGAKMDVPVRLTHPEKVLDPESGLTKRQLAEYYWAVAEQMLPHIAGRPLSLVRCPEGAGKPCFFQKHVNAMLPPGIGSVDVPDKKTGVAEPYITLDTKEALAGLAQMGVLEVHPWGSKNGDLEHPDRLIFDLDPDEAIDWPTLAGAAAEVRKRLKSAGLESFLKLTGGKGLHVVAPIEPELGWTELKELAHKFVSGMERTNPALYLTKMTKAARKGKIYLDYLRNERGATAVAVYSPRARMGAHVSLPLPWTALKEAALPVFSVHDFGEWRGQLKSHPWKAMLSMRQRLEPKKFDGL
jgi:bifunctional non-homologous end joining protein LigD